MAEAFKEKVSTWPIYLVKSYRLVGIVSCANILSLFHPVPHTYAYALSNLGSSIPRSYAKEFANWCPHIRNLKTNRKRPVEDNTVRFSHVRLVLCLALLDSPTIPVLLWMDLSVGAEVLY